jgi:hypothetical protein
MPAGPPRLRGDRRVDPVLQRMPAPERRSRVCHLHRLMRPNRRHNGGKLPRSGFAERVAWLIADCPPPARQPAQHEPLLQVATGAGQVSNGPRNQSRASSPAGAAPQGRIPATAPGAAGYLAPSAQPGVAGRSARRASTGPPEHGDLRIQQPATAFWVITGRRRRRWPSRWGSRPDDQPEKPVTDGAAAALRVVRAANHRQLTRTVNTTPRRHPGLGAPGPSPPFSCRRARGAPVPGS